MKRSIACLLAIILIFTSGLHAFASEPAPETGENAGSSVLSVTGTDEESRGSEEEAEDEKIPDETVSAGAKEEQQAEHLKNEGKTKGQVDVTVRAAVLLGKSVEFTVSLTGQPDKKVVLAADSGKSGEKGGVTFEGLADGTYTLSVTAPGFASYSQEILVEGWAYSVELATGMVKYDEGIPHPGILLIGDVNGDGTVDDTDKEMLVDAVDAGNQAPEYDLNGDGTVDLVDLEYFTKGYKVSGDTSSTVEISVPAEAVDITCDGTARGELASLLKNEGSVALSRADGAVITEDNPVSLTFDFPEKEEFPVDGIVFETGGEDQIEKASVNIVYMENGAEQSVDVPVEDGVMHLLTTESVRTEMEPGGAVCIHLGSQIAVKKVTLKIMGMKKNKSLAEISKVEFVNGMENRIPEPDMNIPENLSAESGNKSFTLTWDASVNVTGYEVEITHGKEKEIKSAKGTTLSVSSLNGEKLENKEEYAVRVQSVNGLWRSGYSDSVTVVPKTDKKPDAPDNLRAVGQFKAIKASWKAVKDADTYNLYYREKGADDYIKREKITANSYVLTDLKNETEYELYVTGVNELGEGKPSLTSVAKTINPDPAQVPKYKLINASEEGKVSEHIIRAQCLQGEMMDSPLDENEKEAWGTVDNNPLSYHYHGTWDSGGYNPVGGNLNANHGLVYEFDEAYMMKSFAVTEAMPGNSSYGYVKVRCWDENGAEINLGNVDIQRKTDSKNRIYYMINLPEAASVKKIQFGLARGVASGSNTVAEVYFYQYDSLEDDIMALYADDLHTVLREDVTQEIIDALRTRLNTPDAASGEYHPDREKLERELRTAEEILNETNLAEPYLVHNGITTSDVNRGFGGLNAWQPLGITAAAGEEITVYVGHNSKKTGESTNLQLIVTQYHSESSGVSQGVNPSGKRALTIGKNEITIPQIGSVEGENGGALYIQYTGNNSGDNYAVRVSGGTEVPTLDLYHVSDRNERLAKAESFLTELDEYVGHISELHTEVHGEKYAYDAHNCILGASDIMLDTMLLSLPAQQIWAGTGSGSVSERAQKLVGSMDAVEGMMHLFYQHKGLNNSAENVIDRYPSRHLNIRYQRMFSGAFMYASGNHIGIEWNETAGMVNCPPVEADGDGKYISGRYFGWGIAHEIGHCINQGSYAVAEVTNNYFSVLAQAKDTNDSVRFKYNNVYDKVTSGTKGPASNVFTQLGLYWQLHLAYDNGYNYKTYENHADQLANLFFARVDSYSRTPGKAPAPGGVALTLSGGTEQNLMRLSCAAAGKDILEFFTRWGFTPDEGTIAYASQFPKETRAIYYANDEARVYRMLNGTSLLNAEGTVEAVGDGTRASVNQAAANQVDFVLDSKTIPAEDVLGYEIVRGTVSGGVMTEETVAFVTAEAAKAGTFSDYVTTINNRVITYKVTVIDKYLNRSAAKTLEPVKIEHDGSIDKTGWSISTSDMTAVGEASQKPEDEADHTCEKENEELAEKAVDNNTNTSYTGTAGGNAEIILEFHKSLTLTGFKYTAGEGTPVKDFEIYVRDGEGWKSVSSGSFTEDKVQTVYFESEKRGNIASYKTTAVKLAVKNMSGKDVTVSELDVLGVTGDNVDFRRTGEGNTAIGRLAGDYVYGKEKDEVIPKGSVVFTGSYKGNPAYNVVMLYDQDGNVVGGVNEKGELKAYQTILADVPDTGNIQDVSDGTWIYWIEPQDTIDLTKLLKVRAELYRVDDALTNEGERMVSDSLFESMPETLPEIQIGE